MGDREPTAGGGAVSSAKKRRLSALQQRFSTKGGGDAPDKGAYDGKSPHAKRLMVGEDVDPLTAEVLDLNRFSGHLSSRLQRPPAGSSSVTAFLDRVMAGNVAQDSAGPGREAAVGGGATKAVRRKVKDRVLQLDNPAPAAKLVNRTAAAGKGRGGKLARLDAASGGGGLGKGRLSTMPQQQRYQQYEPLHKLWLGYMDRLLQGRKHEELLLQADLHGANVKILAAKNPRLVGKQGIIVQERRNSISIITPDNRLFLIGKVGGKFQVALSSRQAMVLRGDAIVGRQ